MNQESNSPERRVARVLLVEDNLDEALLIRRLLEQDGAFKIVHAQDGLRGSQLTLDEEWDLVICDLNLPGAEGMEVIRSSKNKDPRTPVLATTAYTDLDYVVQALRNGADDFLAKPLDPAALLEKAHHLVGRRRRNQTAAQRTVLAVGAHPDDVESGCGGILLRHRAHGHRVVILSMLAGEGALPGTTLQSEAERAAQHLGAQLLIGNAVWKRVPDGDDTVSVIEHAIREYRPDTVYTLSPSDADQDRRNTYRATILAARDVPNLYCYQSPSTTVAFHPAVFVDVSAHMDEKVAVLEAYRSPSKRPEISEEQIRATARYWGRFSGFAEVEPLEVVRSSH